MARFAQRIVSLQPSATVTLSGLGALDRLVARTRYCADVCPEVREREIAIVSDSWTAKAEQIINARPDLVIASVPYQFEAVSEILKAGVRFLGLAPKTIEDIYTDILTIAGAVGAPTRGEEIVTSMQSEIAAVRERTRGFERLSVFCEEWGKPIIRSQPWIRELVEAAGSVFLGDAGKQTTAEEVRDAEPDVVLAAWCGVGNRVPLEKIVTQRGWSNTPAARNRRVFCVSDELFNTPAQTLIGGLKALSWALYPDHFPRPHGIWQIGETRDVS
ncbi:MAG TPA: ABC transporter substrate-binding protein [candidate division Zixibacteria bacterium]|nr:ABC transporter substrate-binding protein [candidate division Zixibacteria bacterium]